MNYTITFSYPEEDLENYLTEAETSEMIKNFNTHLRSFGFQVDELTKANQSIQQKIDKELERNQEKIFLINQIEQNIECIDSEILSKKEILSNLESKINTESFKEESFDLSEFESEGLEEPKSLFFLAKNLLTHLSQIETASIILETKQELLNKKIINKTKELATEIKCVKCKDYYFPLKNFNTACAYHPGNLRYFSCKGCGGDAFYDCCLICKDCSKGCKITFHAS